MAGLKLYCASLAGFKGTTISNQTTHILAQNDEEAYKKSCKVFERIHKDPKVKAYISCIELDEVEGHKIVISQ